MPFESAGAAPASLAPKSKFPSAVVALLVLGAVGFGGWKYLGGRQATNVPTTTTSDPARKFHVFVKSVPDGADIFLGEGKRPIGATPVTLPIDLTGVTSVKLKLKKAGYEDYEQIVVDDTPLSISLTVVGGPPPAPAGTGGAAAAPDPASGAGKEKPSSGSGKSRHRRSSSKPAPSSDDATGEITE